MAMPIVREVGPADKASWLRLRHALWPDCPEHKHALEIDQLLKSDGIVLVAEDGESGLIGFAEVSIRFDHVEGASISPIPYLEGWFVDAAFRKRGVGRELLDAIERWAISRGYTQLASDAEIENTSSIRVHKAFGFSEVGRNVQFLKKLVER